MVCRADEQTRAPSAGLEVLYSYVGSTFIIVTPRYRDLHNDPEAFCRLRNQPVNRRHEDREPGCATSGLSSGPWKLRILPNNTQAALHLR